MKLIKNNFEFYIKIGLLSIFLGILLSSCTHNTFDTEEELLVFIKDTENGYLYQKTINGVDFSLLYKPTDLLVNQEIGDINSKKLMELREKYNNYLYFTFTMSKNNQELLSAAPNNRNEFGAMVNQLAFGMGDKVHLYTEKKDTIQLADYIYPRMYGMSNSTQILFVYPKEKVSLQSKFLAFTIEDIGLNTGEVKFKIPTKHIINQPELLFKH